GRHGWHDSEARGRLGHENGERHRVVLGRDPVLEVDLHRSAVGVGDHQLVLDDHVVKTSALEVAAHLHIEVAGPVPATVSPGPIPFVSYEVEEPAHMKAFGSHLRVLSRLKRVADAFTHKTRIAFPTRYGAMA